MAQNKPNFLIFVSDEHNPRINSVYGHPFVQTPNMQRLARMGTVYENAYCASPLCTLGSSSALRERFASLFCVHFTFRSQADCRGSAASRRASPTKLKVSILSTMTRPGISSQG